MQMPEQYMQEMKNENRLFYGAVVVCLFVIFISLAYVIGSSLGSEQTPLGVIRDLLGITEEEVVPEDEYKFVNKTSIIVAGPLPDTILPASFTVSGTAPVSMQDLTVNVYDESQTLLFSGTVSLLSADPAPVHYWSLPVTLTATPSSTGGEIVVFPNSVGESSADAVKVAVTFAN